MRDFINYLEKKKDLLKIKKKVSPDFEIAAILKKVQDTTGEAVLFENVEGGIRFVGNLYGGRKKIGGIFGVDDKDAVRKCLDMSHSKPISPVLLKSGKAQENVIKDVRDVSKIIPIPRHYEKDAAPFLTAAVVVSKDPDSGRTNLSVNRMQYKGGNKFGIQLVINMHIADIQKKYEAKGKDMEVAVLIGVEPYVFLSATSRPPQEVDEYEFAGALKGKPVELIKCISSDLPVPSNTEIVFEGKILSGVYEMEGPMGEVLQYYGGVSEKQVLTVDVITHRNEPIFQTLLSGSIEEHSLIAVPMEADILSMLRKVSPLVKEVNLLPFFLNCVVSLSDIPETQRGIGKNIAMAALSHPWLKNVIVVNDDINIFDPVDVFWALATRVDMERDVVLATGTHGFPLDQMKVDRNDTVTRAGIDATVDPLHRSRFIRRIVPRYEKININGYL